MADILLQTRMNITRNLLSVICHDQFTSRFSCRNIVLRLPQKGSLLIDICMWSDLSDIKRHLRIIELLSPTSDQALKVILITDRIRTYIRTALIPYNTSKTYIKKRVDIGIIEMGCLADPHGLTLVDHIYPLGKGCRFLAIMNSILRNPSLYKSSTK